MELFFLLKLVPQSTRNRIIEDLSSKGEIQFDTWNLICADLKNNLSRPENVETLISDCLKLSEKDEKECINSLIQINNEELYSIINKKYHNFEDLIDADEKMLKEILSDFNIEEISKALLACSPALKNKITNIINFEEYNRIRSSIGNVQINKITEIHDQLLKKANEYLVARQ